PIGGAESDGRALDGVAEGERRARLHIATLAGAPRGTVGIEAAGWCTGPLRGATTEHLGEDVADVRAGLAAAARGVAHARATRPCAEGGEDVLEAAAPTGTTGPEAGAATRHLADRVVLLALLLVGQHRVRLADVLELLLGRRVTGVLVRVV